MTYRNPDHLRLARLAPRCMACLRASDGTIVAAHSNEGKGMGMKAPDFMWAAMCHRCHAELDQGLKLMRDERRAMWLRAYWGTQEWLWGSGLLCVASEPVPHVNPAPKPSKPMPKGRKLPTGRKLQSGAKIPRRPFPKRPPKE